MNCAPRIPGDYETTRHGSWRPINWERKSFREYSPIAFCPFCGRAALSWNLYGRQRRPMVDGPHRWMAMWPNDAMSPKYYERATWEWCCNECGRHPVCVVQPCDLCGNFKESKPTGVLYRSGVYGWNRRSATDYVTPSKHTLCVACWNRIKPIARQRESIEAASVLLNRLRREIRARNKSAVMA